MARRSLLTLLLLAALVVTAVLVPRTPAGRGWILDRARTAAANAGWTVDWDASSGDPWRRLTLRGLSVEGPGLSAELDRLEVAWFAPGLLTGDLPLWIEVAGGDVTVDADGLPTGGGVGGVPVRPDLRALSLENVRVRVGDAPYTVPDLRLENLDVDGRGDAVTATGRVVTDDGSAAVDATLGLSPFTLVADVRDADLRLARAWWPGVSAGTADGTVRFAVGEGLTARAEVRGGAFRTAGLHVTDVAGPVQIAGGLVEADLSGAALGGPVAATGQVDVVNRRWSATARATPRLADAAAWGVAGWPASWAPSGTATVSASASGWTRVQADGTVRADGTLDGRPLTFESEAARFASDDGLVLRGRGEALGGTLDLSVAPAEGATRLTIEVADVSVAPAEGVTGGVDLAFGGGVRGAFDLRGRAFGLAGGDALVPRISLDGDVETGAAGPEVRAFVSGELGGPDALAGGTFAGAAELRAGEVQGAVTVRDVAVLDGSGASATLSVDGPLAAPPLSLTVDGDAPWTPDVPGLRLDADLRGGVRAVLDGTTLREVDGAFGPLVFTGSLPLTPGTAEDDAAPALAWRLAPTPFRAGRVAGTAEVEAGRAWPWSAGGTRLAGDAAVRGLVAPGVSTPSVSASVTALVPVLSATRPTAALALEADGEDLDASYAEGRLRLTLRDRSLSVAGVPGVASADAGLDLGAPLASLRGEAAWVGGDARLDVTADPDGLRADGVLPEGSRLAGVTLTREVRADVRLGPDLAGTASLRAGDVALGGDVAAGASAFDGTLDTAGRTTTVRLDRTTGLAVVEGRIDLAPLAALADLGIAGRIDAEDVALGPSGRATGRARLVLTAPIAADATWLDGRLDGTATLPGGDVHPDLAEPATLGGALVPGRVPVLEASHPWGVVTLRGTEVGGRGTVPGGAWRGVTRPASPWTVEGRVAGPDAPWLRVVSGASTAAWRDGAWRADLGLPLDVDGRDARLGGTVAAGTADGASGGAPRLDLSVAFDDAHDERLELRGTWPTATVSGSVDASTLASAAELGVELLGRVDVRGTVTAPGDSVANDAPGAPAVPIADLEARWRAGRSELEIDVALDRAGPGGRLTVNVVGDDLDASVDAPLAALGAGPASAPGAAVDGADGAPTARIAVRASEARLGAFLPVLAATSLDGAIAGPIVPAGGARADAPTGDAGWRGELVATRAFTDGAPATARLIGAGREVRLDAAASLAGVDVTGVGTLLPEPDLVVTARHAATGATLDATLRASDLLRLASAELTGSLALPAAIRDGYGLAASRARLEGTLAAPVLIGPTGRRAALAGGRLDGGVVLPVRIAGQPHELRLDLAGPWTGPVVTARLSGDAADGAATLDASDPAALAWRADVALRPGAWPPAAGPLGPVTARVAASGDDRSWTATVDADAAPLGRPLRARADLAGTVAPSGVTLDGAWRLEAPDGAALAAGRIAGGPGGLDLVADMDTLDVDAVAALAGVDASGDATGIAAVRLGAPPGPRPTTDARFRGQVAGVPITAEAHLAAGARDEVRLRSGDAEWIAVREGGATAWTLDAAGRDLALMGELASDLSRGRVSGSVAGHPFEADVVRDGASALLATVRWAGAGATLGVRGTEGGWTASLDASAPDRAELPVAGSLTARLAAEDGTIVVERGDVVLLRPTRLEADLAGPLAPAADVRGTVALSLAGRSDPPGVADPGGPGPGEPIALTVRGPLGAWTARAAAPGLALAVEGAGATLLRGRLGGEGRSVAGLLIAPGETGLAWDAATGWRGDLRATLAGTRSTSDASASDDAGAAPSDTVAVAATGEGEDLRLRIDAALQAGPATTRVALDATATGAPWNASLAGAGTLLAEVQRTADGPDGTAATAPALVATAPVRLSGSLAAPVASGDVALVGVVDASGPLRMDLAGATVALTGERLDLRARAGGDGWSAAVDARSVPLDAWLGGVVDPRLDLRGEAEAAWGAAPRGRIEAWTLSARGGRAEGSADWSDAVALSARVDADLGALLGGAATGRLAGPVTLRAEPGTPLGRAEVTAALTADDVRLAGAAVDGGVTVDGALPAPDLRADLRLGGPVDGELHLGWRPADGRLDLDADLVAQAPDGPVAVDLTVAGGETDLRASGTVTTPDGTLIASAEGDAVRLVGDASLAGVAATVRPFAWDERVVRVEAPLGALVGAARGRADLRIGPGPDGWLRGAVDAPAVAGVELPALTVGAAGPRVHLSGAGAVGSAQAELNLGSRAWRVALANVALPGGIDAALDAEGRGATGEARARLASADGDALEAALRRDAAGLVATAAGELAGGDVALDLRRDGAGWVGDVRIEDVSTRVGRVDLAGDVHGTGRLPSATLAVSVDGPVPVRGTVRAGVPPEGGAAGDGGAARRPGATSGPTRVAIDLRADLPGGAAADVRGEAWPAVDLTITGADAADGTAGAEDAATRAGVRIAAPSWSGPVPWRATGATTLTLPGVTIDVAPSATGAPSLRLRPDAVPDGALVADLPATAPADAVGAVVANGLEANGEGAISGTVAWLPPLGADLRDVRIDAETGRIEVRGRVRDGVADVVGAVAPRVDVPGADEGSAAPLDLAVRGARALAGDGALPFTLTGGAREATLRFGGDGAPGRGTLAWSAAGGEARLDVAAPGLAIDLALGRGEGLVGTVQADDVEVPFPGGVRARIDGEIDATGDRATGRASIRGPGRVEANGSADLRRWLPAGFLPRPDDAAGDAAYAPDATEVSVRLADLDVGAVPGLAAAVPSLAGGLSAVVEVRGTRILAQLAAPDLRAAGREVPLRLEGAGDLGPGGDGVGFTGAWAGSPVQGTLNAERLELLWTLKRFPIQAALEARFGPLDVGAEATGVLRVDLPWRDPRGGSVRLATEHVRLERAGVVTTGTASVTVDRSGVEVRAAFEGDGRWRAEGSLQEDELDFVLEADDADATPLLGLVPSLARLGAGADGDLTVTAQGDLARPRIEAATDGLELALAGARYRLSETRATLIGADLRVDAVLTGVEPVGGRLIVGGNGRLRLDPWRLEDAAIELNGTVNAPLIGQVDAVEGRIDADPQGRPRLALEGRLGAPLEVEGTLWPLDVTARGDDLTLRIPTLLLDRAVADAELRLVYRDLFRLSGRVEASEGRFELGIRPRRAQGAEARGPSPGLSRLAFDDLAIVGRRLSFSENVGSAEFDADLRLGGTAAVPTLSGAATAQRGVFRFSGRDFTLVRGEARFEASRGVWPTVDVAAVATFEKRDVLASAPPGTRFERPAGPTFDVRLAFEADVLPTPGDARPFRLDIDPLLTTDAEIVVPAGEGLTAGTRALTEPELISLLTLGRLDLGGDLAREGGVAGGVAASALDSAVDLLILAELQAALSDALGLDLVEIRTSTLSSVLAGDDDPFGVSLRLGGYVSEGLFASFEVGRFADGADGDALANTLALTYQLGPVAFDLSTRLAFADDEALTPTPALAAALRYQLTPYLAVETGASLSTVESEGRFGVTLRW